ncbi:MAG: flotillin-like protein FloA [Pirellulaceae bacterium]
MNALQSVFGSQTLSLLAQQGANQDNNGVWFIVTLAAIVIGGAIAFGLFIAFIAYGKLWFQGFMSSADVSLISLIGMHFRQVRPSTIVNAKIMAAQAGLDINRRSGISTQRLEAHFLAGGDVMRVINAIIAAQRANIELDFDQASAIDLAGRDVLDAVKTSVYPKVIECPDTQKSGKRFLSAIARDGVELKIRARVTVRTNLGQLIGGATEETVIARVGESIISSIGSSDHHQDVLENPDRISKAVLARGLDAHTAFEIVSIDIADIDVGENIGARLQADQAEADMRVARAKAERRRAEAIATEQENKANVAQNRARLVLAEAEVPQAMADAFRGGNLQATKVSGDN